MIDPILAVQKPSMNVLIVYCHPSTASYTYEMLKHLKAELMNSNHNIEVSDLYAMDFKSELSEQEYEREGLSNLGLPIPEDIKHEHKKLEWSDAVIFLYPVWWSDCPARLKGWFDRVYTVGYIYKQRDNLSKLKRIPFGFVLCTAGYSNEELIQTGIALSMQAIMVNDRLGDRFQNKEMIILGGTLDKQGVNTKHKLLISELVKKIQ